MQLTIMWLEGKKEQFFIKLIFFSTFTVFELSNVFLFFIYIYII